jgi:ATP-independent RNA helicase DbpA
MLDMGFFEDIKKVISNCPKQRQTLLFSATYPDEIKKLSKQFMKSPREVIIETEHTEIDIEQRFFAVENPAKKLTLLKAILQHYQPAATLIFCNTKQQTTELSEALRAIGYSALALNGDMEQAERDQVLIRFVNRSCAILVATDVAARGIDIKELPAVINYELAFERDVHTHRIGRTGRAGHQGLALSLTSTADAERIAIIQENVKQPLVWGKLADLNQTNTTVAPPEMVTICLDSGRKDKIRPGDILGALTKDAGLPPAAIGKIDIAAIQSFVAIKQSHAGEAYRYLQNGKLKGRKVSVKKLR